MDLITVEELKRRMDAGEKINLVDVREPYEHDEFNIGGILLPLSNFRTMEIEPIENLKDEEVVLYCRSGNRSGQAALILDGMGFSSTKNLAGGMLAWKEKIGS